MANIGRVPRLVGVRILSAALQALTLVILARSATLVEFGLYSASIAVGSILVGILGFGMTTRVLRVKAENRGFDLIPAFMAYTVIASFLTAALVIFYATQIAPALQWWAIAAATYVAAELISNFSQSSLFGEGKTIRAEVAIVTRRLVPFVPMSISAIVSPDFIFESASAGFLLSILVSLIIFGKRNWQGWNWRSTFVEGVHYWAASLWSMLQQLDMVIINATLGPAPTGAYAAAFRLASPVHIVTSSITALMIPAISSVDSQYEKSKLSRRYFIAGVAYSGTLLALSPAVAWIAPLILGEQYGDYGWLFMLMIVNSAISVINQIMSGSLYSEGRSKAVARSTAISTSIGLTVIFLMAYKGSLLGVALGTILIQASLFFILLLLLKGLPSTE